MCNNPKIILDEKDISEWEDGKLEFDNHISSVVAILRATVGLGLYINNFKETNRIEFKTNPHHKSVADFQSFLYHKKRNIKTQKISEPKQLIILKIIKNDGDVIELINKNKVSSKANKFWSIKLFICIKNISYSLLYTNVWK